MPAAQHQRGAGFGNTGDQLCQCKAGFHIPAHRVQQDQKPLDAGILLHRHQLGDDVLVLGGLLPLRRFRVTLDLPDDGQAVDGVAAPVQRDRAKILDLIFFQTACIGVFLFFLRHFVSPPAFFCQYPPPGAPLSPGAAKIQLKFLKFS